MQSFLVAHPGVRVDLRLADGFIDLVEQGIDIAVRIGELADSSLIARRAGTTRRGLMVSRQYIRSLPDGLGPPRHPEDLLKHNCIVYSELPTKNACSFVAGPGADAEPGSVKTVRVGGALQTNSSEIVRAAVLAGQGVGYSPIFLFEAELAQGEVVAVLADWTVQDLPVHVVSPPQRRHWHSAKVRAFGDHVTARI